MEICRLSHAEKEKFDPHRIFPIANGKNSIPLQIIFHSYHLYRANEKIQKTMEAGIGLKQWAPDLKFVGKYQLNASCDMKDIQSIQTLSPDQYKEIPIGNARYVSVIYLGSNDQVHNVSINKIITQNFQAEVYFKHPDYLTIKSQRIVENHHFLYHTSHSPARIGSPNLRRSFKKEVYYPPGHCYICSEKSKQQYPICEGHLLKDIQGKQQKIELD